MFRFAASVAALLAASALSVAQAQTYSILHPFVGGGSDGAQPCSNVVIGDSTLYGMTEMGGTAGYGTVFKIGANGGGFSVLHSFAGGSGDGSGPLGGLVVGGSTLYGMTGWGGGAGDAYGYGAVFKIGADGNGFGLLHSFTGGSDGRNPAYSSLVLSGTTLYGMTEYGGSSSSFGSGTIFKVGIDGSGYTVLHSFTGGSNDGADPHGGLTVVGTTLYGLTKAGGASDHGTLFKIGADGNGFSVLHSFTGAAGDGSWPCGDLTLSGTTLYGTTEMGGAHNSVGTIFKIGADGNGYGVLHSFDHNVPNDAAYSVANLTIGGQTMYGTAGGGLDAPSGVVFQMNLDGSGFTRLHTFLGGAADGDLPGSGSLALDRGTLYGVTTWGGSSVNNGHGYGTLFSIAVPEPSTFALLTLAAGLLLAARRRQNTR
jgi:uncharacterized repeat protein (TIGR03803 family)